MSTSSGSFASYHCSARSLAAKSALPLAAGAAAFLSASTLHAEVVSAQPTTDNVASSGTPLFIDFDTLSVSSSNFSGYDATLIASDDGDGNISSFVAYSVSASVVVGGYTFARKLDAGTLVNASLGFDGSNLAYFSRFTGDHSPDWQGATTGYIGLKTLDISTADQASHYGWLKISINADASTITLLAFGYNKTPNAGLLTGQTSGEAPTPVPEPATSAALLALGAAGLVAYRQRKQLRRA